MKQLAANILDTIPSPPNLSKPTHELLTLPEKALQFGTGVLLRGLPDYYIDKANKQGIFNGRIVVVKSTDKGDTHAFGAQDNLYLQVIRGLQQGNKVEEDIINASISRVLTASTQWADILTVAESSDLDIVISNTTEVGIQLDVDDKIFDAVPLSYPGKLLAVLYHRFKHFNGEEDKGLVIIPTELIVDNAGKLQSIVEELATLNNLEPAFTQWLQQSNYFCSSLVDRIVPGAVPQQLSDTLRTTYGFNDDLMIMSEPYSLWAIEVKNSEAKERLSFAQADAGVVLADDINKFRELKLRLLNGTHTLTCGLAYLAGFKTVKQAMADNVVSTYVSQLMLHEIASAITGGEISFSEAKLFAADVMDRFRNPFIEHQWLSISLQYSGKMKMRVVPILLKHYDRTFEVPLYMALGFAAYIVFMKNTVEHGQHLGISNGITYPVNDDRAPIFAEWYSSKNGDELVKTVLSDTDFWETDLSSLPGFTEAVTNYVAQIEQGHLLTLLQSIETNR